MTVKVQITLEDGKLAVRCPFWANDLIKGLPDRRWSKAKKAWMAPLLRKNVEAIRALFKIEGVEASPDAVRALDEYGRRAAARTPPKNGAFPAWYQFRTKLTRQDGTGVDEFPVRAHQMKVLNKKYSKEAFALHHDMGTGKTRTEIDNACALRMEGKIDAVLVVVKLSGRINWLEQFVGPMSIKGVTYNEGWAPIPVSVYLPSTDDPKGFERWLTKKHDFKVMVIGMESLSQGRMPDFARRFMLTAGKVHMIIDESSLISNYSAGRTQVCLSLGKQAVSRCTMTGTPISTGPLDLFSQFQFLDPEIIGIGDFYAFRNHYAIVLERETKAGQKYPLVIGYKNIDELTREVAPYVDEVRKADVLPDLPPKNYLPHVMVQMTKQQRELYDRIRKERAYEVKGKGEHVIKNVLELMLRLHQVAGGFTTSYMEEAYIGKGGVDKIRRNATWHPIIPWNKNPKVIELVDIAKADRQFIIWAAYRPEIQAIVDALSDAYPKERICQIHGGVDEADRAIFRREYQRGKYKYMVGNTATGGMADTWTACETMVYYNNTHKMIDRAQSEDRAHRDGLDHVVDYIDLIAEKTVDVHIYKSNVMKMDLAEYIRMNIRNMDSLLEGGEPAGRGVPPGGILTA